jgi:hypothetical protein
VVMGRRQRSGYALKEVSSPKGDVDGAVGLDITRVRRLENMGIVWVPILSAVSPRTLVQIE